MRIFRILKEINNWIFLLRQVRRHSKTEPWLKQKYPLRVNWIGSIYTVINLPPEVFNSEPIYEKPYVIEETKSINSYLASINLAEIIHLEAEKINKPETEAYLVKYSPRFEELTWGWIIKWSSIIGILFYLQKKFDYISHIVNLYNWIGNLISPYVVQ
jgi:hypothetical protein